jgi:hypothetical protein
LRDRSQAPRQARGDGWSDVQRRNEWPLSEIQMQFANDRKWVDSGMSLV